LKSKALTRAPRNEPARGSDMAVTGGAEITAGTICCRCPRVGLAGDAARIPGRPDLPTTAVVPLVGHWVTANASVGLGLCYTTGSHQPVTIDLPQRGLVDGARQ
jgi:hypothetical protein